MSQYYPIYLNVADRLCVVVGGGQVAARKSAGLLEAGARVRLVSLEINSELQSQVEESRLEFIQTTYEAAHLQGATLVFAATNRREVNAQVAEDAGALRIPVNVVDAPEEGNFIVPAVVRRGDFCLCISTGGNNPLLAVRLQREMEERFGSEYGEFVQFLGQMRETIKGRTNDTAKRRLALSFLLDNENEIRALIAAGRTEAAHLLASSLVESVLSSRTVE